MNFISSYYFRYASLGFSVVPIKTLAYSYQSQVRLRDSTGDKEAKQPLVNWLKYQTEFPTPQDLDYWSREWPGAGIAIVTGVLSNVLAVDDDRATRPSLLPSERDEDAEKVFQAYLTRYGSYAETARLYKVADDFCDALRSLETAIDKTSRGRHFYFRMPLDDDGQKIKLGKRIGFLPSMDVQAEGAYAIVPPSIHPTGTAYCWEREPEDGILPLPHWVYEAIVRLPNVAEYKPSNLGQAQWEDGALIPQGQRNDSMAKFFGHVLATRFPNEMDWNTAAWDVLKRANIERCTPEALGEDELKDVFTSICNRERKKRGSSRPQFNAPYEPGSVPETITAKALGIKDLHAPDYAVDGFILDGTTQLFGKPKSGKTYLAFQTAVAVASGQPLFPRSLSLYAYADHPSGFGTHRGEVLYLALEDSQLRVRDRLRTVLGGAPMPDGLEFATQWPNLHDGGLKAIEDWLERTAHPRLIVVDTIAAFVGVETASKGSVFRAEYRMFRPIWEMGQLRKVPILVIDHASKSKGKFGSGDPYDSGAGTLGSQACVDTVMVMEHADKGPTARINYKGRDIERGFLDLEHAKNSPLWKIAAPIIESTEEPALAKRKNGHTSSKSSLRIVQ